METVSRFTSTLHKAGSILQTSRKEWAEHLQQVENQQAVLNEKHPVAMIINSWASANTVLAALERLQARDQLLKSRIQCLSSVYPGLRHVTAVDLLAIAMHRPLVSSERRLWQLITAISEVEEIVTERLQFAETLEMRVTGRYERTIAIQETITTAVTAEDFAVACVAAATLDSLKDTLDSRFESTVEDVCLWYQFEELYDFGKRKANNDLLKLERSIHILHNQMSGLGIKLARQTLIEEYFMPQDA